MLYLFEVYIIIYYRVGIICLAVYARFTLEQLESYIMCVYIYI